MFYINAIELIDLCVNNEILQEKDGQILIYRNKGTKMKAGWYLNEKNTVARELMDDEEGQNTLKAALEEKHIEFKPSDYSWLDSWLESERKSIG